MGRAPCCDKASVKKGPWSPEEDAKLKEFIDKHGTGGNWIALPHKAGLNRCGKSCRLRWLNYLRPNIKHGEFSQEEERIICALFASIGSRWSIIASHLPGRTDNDIKNYWNTKLKKKFLGIVSTHPSRKQQQQQQEQLHHQQQQQQQQQYYYYLSPFLSSSSAVQLGHPELELLTGFGAPLPPFCDQNGPSFPSARCMHSSSMINFGSDASCSSSGGSCAPIDCVTAAQFDYGCDGKVFEGEQFATSIDNYSIYPGNLDNSNRLLLGGGAAGHHLGIPLHYTYGEEEIKNLLSSSSGCNNACNSSLF